MTRAVGARRGGFTPSRLAALHWVRVSLVVLVLATTGIAPDLVGMALPEVAIPSACFLLAAVGGELLRQRKGLPVVAASGLLLLDAAYVAAVLALGGGPGGPLIFLAYAHLVAVTVLLSFRTGLKIALWYSLLLIATHYVARMIGPEAAPPTTTVEQAAFAVVTFWVVALAAAAFAALNERELVRHGDQLGALSDMAAALESTTGPADAVAVALRAVRATFGFARAAAVLHVDGGPLVLVASGGGGEVAATRAATGDGPAVALAGPELRRTIDAAGDPLLAGALPEARNVVILPLSADGESLGRMAVERGGPPGERIDASTVAVLDHFAGHAALAIRNACLMEKLSRLSLVDELTGLANRRALDDALHRELARAERSGEPFSVALVDIDHFKAINDGHGHHVGDDVLRHVGRVVTASARPGDVCARVGGEEFVILLPGCTTGDAEAVLERLRAAIAGGGPVPVTASAGLATLRVHGWAHDLLEAADEALYEAKRSGRDRVVVSSRHLASAGGAPAGADVDGAAATG